MKTLKRVVFFLLAVSLVLLICMPAVFAEEGAPAVANAEPAPPDSYLSWEILATSGGAVAATLIIVQFLKLPLDKVHKVPTRYIVYVISLILLLLYEVVINGGLVLTRIPLIALNAIIVTLGAMGAYEATFAKAMKC